MTEAQSSSVAGRTVASALPGSKLISASPSDSVTEAAIRMSQARCGCALVLENNVIVGIITERDILTKIVAKGIDPKETRIDQVMTKRPVCAPGGITVKEALFLMRELGFRHLPVLDSNHRPLGIFALRDALPDELAEVDSLYEGVRSFIDRRDREADIDS
jgi:CBS domain-containing protein